MIADGNTTATVVLDQAEPRRRGQVGLEGVATRAHLRAVGVLSHPVLVALPEGLLLLAGVLGGRLHVAARLGRRRAAAAALVAIPSHPGLIALPVAGLLLAGVLGVRRVVRALGGDRGG